MPAFKIPKRSDFHTYAAVFYGVMVLVWLSSESKNVFSTSLLGVGMAFGITSLFIIVRFGERVLMPPIWLPGVMACGAFIGLASSFTTSLLMVMKNVQHSHLYPDFPGEVVVGIWQRAPAWMLAGILLSAALALARVALYVEEPSTNSSVPSSEI